jgi:SAM-dependent methyltransferase
MNGSTINSIHRNKVGKASDKWESYLGYYDALFAPLRERPISMLEIGVQNGGSLETWAEYFQAGQRFIGCDIDPKCGSLKYDDSRISIVVGDANAAPAFHEIRSICPEFDVIIDDGSHRSTDILNAFVNYFPLLKPGGLFVVEDTHTLYNDQFGGGILNESGAYSFFKKLIDVISFQFWRDEVSINTFFRTFFPLQSTPGFILDGWVDSINFRNSIITITKSMAPGHDKLGERILVGNSAQVQTWGGTFRGSTPPAASGE